MILIYLLLVFKINIKNIYSISKKCVSVVVSKSKMYITSFNIIYY